MYTRRMPSDDASTGATQPWWIATFDATYPGRYVARNDAEARTAVATFAARGVFAANHRVLDLCCGGGRYLEALANAGARPIGLDFSSDLLQLARRRGDFARVVRGDMRALPFAAHAFDAVIQMFTAFGYFESDEENFRVLAEVARVLTPGGHYALDVFNLTTALVTLIPESTRTLADGTRVHETRRFDTTRRRIEKTVELEREGAREHRFESVRAFEPAELGAWLERAGFDVEARLGEYVGTDYDAACSSRMLTLARRI
jgi:ubiquinone/menaquinone biosynthesis C-methylase UbiE